jgi:hypothetical protein
MDKRFRLYPASLILVVLAWLAFVPAASAQGNTAFIITGVDKSKFPNIQVNFRAVDLGTNQVMTNLTTPTIKVYENGQAVRVQNLTRQNDGPVNIIFVIDLGMKSAYKDFGIANLRDIITALARESYFINGKDTVQVLARENINSDQTTPLLELTQDGSALIDWANQFDFLARSHTSRKPTKGLQGVKDAIDAAAKVVQIPGSQTTAIIFITHSIEDPVPDSAVQIAQTLAVEAMQQHISLYAFQTILNPNDKKLNTPLTILTAGSINGYTPLYAGDKNTSINSVYESIQTQRTVYTLTYQSQAKSAGEQRITIGSPQPRDSDRAGSYEISDSEIAGTAPTVAIVQPAQNSTFRLESTVDADGNTTITSPGPVTIVAEVTWPAGVQHHPFSSAQLLVRNAPLEDVEPQWNSDQSRVTFSWDISKIQQSQLNVPVTVKLGDDPEAIQADLSINIEVVTAPVEHPKSQPEGPSSSVLIIAGLVVGAVLFILLVVAVSIFFLRRSARAGQGNKPARGAPARPPSGGQKDLPTLSVLEGPAEMRGKTLDLPKMVTILGRSQEEADIVFYKDIKSSVSRVHCTLRARAGRYYLTDNNSSNGTYVNGKLLQPEQEVQVKNGDEIFLGDATKNAVRLRFNLTPRN